MKFTLLQRRSVRSLLILAIIDAIFFSYSNPAKVSPLWLILGYILAVVTLYWFFRGVTGVIGVYSKAIRSQRRQLTRLFTGVAAIVVAMQSMGQLSVRDVLVLLPLALVGYLYLLYNHRPEPTN